MKLRDVDTSEIVPRVVIMHDHRRAERLDPLSETIRDDYDGAILVANGTRAGPWQSLKFACWFAVESKATHLIAFEDDAIVARNCVKAAMALAALKPDTVIHLYAGAAQAGDRILAAELTGRQWCEPAPSKVMGNAGVVIPVDICRRLLEWASNPSVDHAVMQCVPHKPLSGDTRLWMFLREHRMRSLIFIPSIVDHDDDAESCVGTTVTDSRRAYRICDDDPLDIEVTPEVVKGGSDRRTRIVLPFRGEFGIKVWRHVPAVHGIAPDVVCCEAGEEALYPAAGEHYIVPSPADGERRNRISADAEMLAEIRAQMIERFGLCEFIVTDEQSPVRRFVPRPFRTFGIACDVVICPRVRSYGSSKNWPHWESLHRQLASAGLSVFAGGIGGDYETEDAAWNYKRPLDATIEAMRSARLVIATDAGLAHLAVLCGVPLMLISHGEGLVAPGPVLDAKGAVIQESYWPIRLDRYHEANHRNVEISMVKDGWTDPDRVVRAAIETLTMEAVA